MTVLTHIADRVLYRPLLLLPEKAAMIMDVLAGRIGIEGPEASRFVGDGMERDMTGRMVGKPFRHTEDGVGILSIVGSMVNRGAYLGAQSGLVSYEGIQHQIKALREDDTITSVVLDIQSPGGEATGAFETAAMVRTLAEEKRVVAVVNGMAASAGYAIASGANEIVTTQTGISGSIGVVLLHADYSRKLANEGISPTIIFAGKHKVDGHPFGPLSEEVRSDLQAEVELFYEKFLETVARGRGNRLDASSARDTNARTFMGERAVEAGLADRTGTFESVLEDLSSAPSGRISSPNRRISMSDKNSGPAAEDKPGISQADMDAAVAKAKADALESFSADASRAAEAEKLQIVSDERTRIAALHALTRPGAESIIAEAIASGASKEETAFAIMDAGLDKNAARLSAFAAEDAIAAAATPVAEGAGSVPNTEEGWRAEWAGSDKLQAEFITAEDYSAFKKKEQAK